MWRCTCAWISDFRSLANTAGRSLIDHDANHTDEPNGRGWTEIIMDGARSPAYVDEPFYERLRAAALPDPLQSSISNSLAVLLEDDGDGVVPDDRFRDAAQI